MASSSAAANRQLEKNDIKLPLGVAGIGLRQTFPNGETVAIGLQRSRQVAVGYQHIAKVVVQHRQIALPLSVAGVGLRSLTMRAATTPMRDHQGK
jgi:hypothetical protein